MVQFVQLGAGHPPFMLDPSHEAEAGLPPGGVGHAESQTGQRLPCGAETDGDLGKGEAIGKLQGRHRPGGLGWEMKPSQTRKVKARFAQFRQRGNQTVPRVG